MDMFKRIVLVHYEFPTLMKPNGKDLVGKLLVRKVSDRLGMACRGHYDVRDHPWFAESGCNFRKLLKKELTPPWLPEVKDPLDSSNFDDYSHVEREFEGGASLSKEEQAIFAGF
jgi:protein kinase A